jgi:hypothetical protein
MLFEGEIFKWGRLENLLTNASKQSEINIESLIDQVLDFLFSENGGILRDELIETVAKRIDLLNLYAMKTINKQLPVTLRSKNFKEDVNDHSKVINDIEPIQKLIAILQKMPGFNAQLVLKKIKRLIQEPYARKMSIKIAQKFTKKSVARIIKIAAGVEQ